MEIVQIICYFGFIVFLPRMFSGCHGILNTIKSKTCKKKYDKANILNNVDYFHSKKKTCLNEDSSKGNCRHIYQIKALVKIFLLNIVSNSAVFRCVLRLQGTSEGCIQTNRYMTHGMRGNVVVMKWPVPVRVISSQFCY